MRHWRETWFHVQGLGLPTTIAGQLVRLTLITEVVRSLQDVPEILVTSNLDERFDPQSYKLMGVVKKFLLFLLCWELEIPFWVFKFLYVYSRQVVHLVIYEWICSLIFLVIIKGVYSRNLYIWYDAYLGFEDETHSCWGRFGVSGPRICFLFFVFLITGCPGQFGRTLTKSGSNDGQTSGSRKDWNV